MSEPNDGPKSAYELALQRLEKEGIEKPREDALTTSVREQIREVRQRARARLAELEILHRDGMASVADPAERDKDEANYRAERERIESRCDREVEKLRRGAS